MVSAIQPAIPVFQGNGYAVWSIKMKTFLIYEDLWELVDKGYEEEELPRDERSKVRRTDVKALLFIQQAVDESIFSVISKATNSKDAWDALQTEYQSIVKEDFQVNLGSVMPDTSLRGREASTKKMKEEREYRERIRAELKKKGETHLIVSALITTVTFAAGFTLPGGYRDDGKAVLSKKAAFGAFVVTDSIAMVSSLCAVFLHFFMTLRKHEEYLETRLRWAFIFTMGGMLSMVIAFATGMFVVLPHLSALPYLTFIICACFFICFAIECDQFLTDWLSQNLVRYVIHFFK